jgi:hypothetical protein
MEVRTRYEQLRFQGILEKFVERLPGKLSFNGFVLPQKGGGLLVSNHEGHWSSLINATYDALTKSVTRGPL